MAEVGPARRRREEAFERHVVPEIPVLLRVAATLTDQAADAEDLVQDTLVRAYRAVERFDGEHPRAWLLTILRRTQMNRARVRRPELLHDPDVEGRRVVWSASAGESAESLVVGEVFDAAVAEALAALPGVFRRVVELVDVAGLSYAEAAELLGVPEGTVMSRLHRGRSRMRRRLAAAGLAPRRGVL